MTDNNIIEFDPNRKKDKKREAKSLYWRGWSVNQISDDLDVPIPTIHSWKSRDKWDDTPMIERIESNLDYRLSALILKEKKEGRDFKEIDLLMRQIASIARVHKYEDSGKETDLREKPRKKPKNNHFTVDQVEQLRDIFENSLYDYQRRWYENRDQRNRMILKARQIGATYYFAFEALLDAIETGRNEIFLSASRAQALQFRSYIVAFAKQVGVNLTGDPMLITSEALPANTPAAELHFLGTNFRTAQGRHGNLYFDEFFWTFGFEELFKVASGMATHKKWRRTLFSTPSTIAHAAYAYWNGERHNKRKKKQEQIDIDVSHEALRLGALGPDRVWRNVVTVDDAAAGGCDLFDIEELKAEYSAEEFANLFGCQFVDDSLSAFSFESLKNAMVDSLADWDDFNPQLERPFGDRPVWAGYDPQNSEEGDNAALVILAPPEKTGGKFRILERCQLRGLDFQQQATFIKDKLSRYNCTYLGIERSGIGDAVCQCIDNEINGIVRIEYSLETKQRMVMKAQNLLRLGRLEMDAECIDIASSFISIKKTITNSGKAITFRSDRARDTGHADLAWAIMHVLINEPLDGSDPMSKAMKVKFF